MFTQSNSKMEVTNNDLVMEAEQALNEDPNGEHRKRLLAKLYSDQNNVRMQLAKGVAPDEYKLLEQANASLKAAIDFVETYKP